MSPIVKQLNQRLGGTWKAVRSDLSGFGWMYVQDGTGRTVRPYAESVLDYDGYSDTKFVTVYIDNNGVTVGRAGVVYYPPLSDR